MKKKTFKKLLALLMSGVLVLGMTACGGEDVSTTDEADVNANVAEEEAQSTEPLEEKTLRIITWSNGPSVDAMKQLAKKYMEKYPNVTVEITDVDTNQYQNLQFMRLQTNEADIITMGGGSFLKAQEDWAPTEAPAWQQFCDNGALLDITDQPWVDNWSTGAKVCEYNGRIYGIATGANAMTGLYYNKAMFEEHGWEVPETWADFEKLCSDIKTAGISPLTCGGADLWPYSMIVHGIMGTMGIDYQDYVEKLWKGEAALNDETGLEVYRRIDFINNNLEPGFMGISYAEVIGRFIGEKAAMLPDGSWQAAEITKADPDFSYGYFPLPATNGNTQFEGKFDLYFAINAKSENVEEALAWMEMLSEKDNYSAFVNTCGFIPTMDGVMVTNDFLKELLPYTEDMKNAWGQYYRAPSNVGKYAEGSVAFNGQYLKSADGPIATVEELADLAQKDFWDAVESSK